MSTAFLFVTTGLIILPQKLQISSMHEDDPSLYKTIARRATNTSCTSLISLPLLAIIWMRVWPWLLAILFVINSPFRVTGQNAPAIVNSRSPRTEDQIFISSHFPVYILLVCLKNRDFSGSNFKILKHKQIRARWSCGVTSYSAPVPYRTEPATKYATQIAKEKDTLS